MQTINIGTEINLLDLLQSRMLIQANSGGGKSVLARVIIEETFGKVPFIVMDIEGEYYTLKEKFGDVLIIGGQHADIPISMKSVKLLPKEIISNRLSVVIDLSDLQMSDRIMYAKYFLETMMDLNKDYWINYLVFIEEAHKLCGEQDKQASATAVKDLMSRGRKRGYCGILLTQRISKLHKDAAAECNNKFIGRTFLDIDLDRAAKELGLSSQSDKNEIRTLDPGNFYAFGTSIKPHHVHVVKINLPKTKIPKAGVDLDIKPQKPTEKIKSMLVKLNELPAEAGKELKTMQQLQQEVNRLKHELSKATKTGNSLPSSKDANQIEKLQKRLSDLQFSYDDLNSHYKEACRNRDECMKVIKFQGKQITDSIQILSKQLTAMHNLPTTVVIKKDEKEYDSPAKNFVDHNNDFATKVYDKVKNNNLLSNSQLPVSELRILTACAQYPNGLTRGQITGLVGLKKSSRDAYIARLKQKNLIAQISDRIISTDEGINILGPDFEKLPTGTALQEYWKANLPISEWKILDAAINNYPDIVTREALTESTGLLKSSRDAYIARLKQKELIITPAAGEIKAAEILFN